MARTICNVCKGTGICDMCDGTGIVRTYYSREIVYYTRLDELQGNGKEGEPKKCTTHCKQTGKCMYCDGTGYRNY